MYDNKDAIFKFNTSFINFLTTKLKLKESYNDKNNLYEYIDKDDNNLILKIPDYYVDEYKINPHVTIFKMNELKDNNINKLKYNLTNDIKKNQLIILFN